VTAAASPLLALCWLWGRPHGLGLIWMLGLWVVTVVLVESVSWALASSGLESLLSELEADDVDGLRESLADLRRRATECEGALTHSSALLEDLSSSLGDGLLVVTSDLHIRLINPVALRFCGAESVTPASHLLEILRNPQAVEAVQSAAGGGAPEPVVIENPRGLWEVHAFPVRGGGAVVLLSDVGLVRKAAELRRRFVQDLSHELRSPLTVMRTTVEAMEGEVESEQAGVLIRQVERIDRLTAELYELASIEAGEVELTIEPLSAASLVREVVADFEPEAERAEVELRVEIDDALHCACDRRGLYRVLSNLFDNAIKYNHPGGWVRVRGRTLLDGRLEIEVADSGEGIPPEELPAVMQRFYRVDRARTPGRGGLGLGLAIVKHMVQLMGGVLTMQSRVGVGTQVLLTLPGGVDAEVAATANDEASLTPSST
jgi:signal transduction histidine kinase